MKLNKLYASELRAARRAAELLEAHDVLTNISLWAFGLAFLMEIFFFLPIG